MPPPINRERLSYADADALARKYAEGHALTPFDQQERIRQMVEEEIDRSGYARVDEVTGYMQERGLQRYEAEADPNIVQQTVCEDICSQKAIAARVTGPDLDNLYWTCMRECSPVRSNYDPTTPSSPVEEEYLGQRIITFSGKNKR